MENEKYDGWRAVTTQDVGELLDRDGIEADPIDTAVIANFLNKEFIENLKKGWIPCLARIDEGGENAEVQATLTPDQVKSLWRVFTKMTEEEMDESIKESGLYDGAS